MYVLVGSCAEAESSAVSVHMGNFLHAALVSCVEASARTCRAECSIQSKRYQGSNKWPPMCLKKWTKTQGRRLLLIVFLIQVGDQLDGGIVGHAQEL